jgi:hypothetical protein
VTSNNLTRPLVAGPAIAVLAAAIVATQIGRDRQYPRPTVSDHLLYVQSGETLKRLALSFDALAADVYWIRAIQHFGGERLSSEPRNYALLYPLLDLTTSLDPYFGAAYRFGSIFLGEPLPGGAGRPDLAVRLLQKGIGVEGRWQYFHDIGFVHYWYTGNYAEAAEWFKRAAKQPGAPYWLEPLAAATLAQGGQRGASRLLWQQVRETSENDFMRTSAERRLVQLDVLDFIDRFQPIVDKYASANPDRPLTWERLLADGVIRRIPVDAAGTPFDLNPWWGTLTVSQKSPLYPMPSEPPPIVQGPP